MIVAATYPFRKIIGIEVCEELASLAKENLAVVKRRLRCPDCDVVTGDACSYAIPDDVSVVFLYNPARGPVLERILNNLRASLIKAPRAMTIVFKHPENLKAHLGSDSWLVKKAEMNACDAEHKILFLECRP